MFALIDPFWGNPKIIVDTISETREECLEKSLISEECSLYSGMRYHGMVIKKGSFEKLINHGYRIKEIEMRILE